MPSTPSAAAAGAAGAATGTVGGAVLPSTDKAAPAAVGGLAKTLSAAAALGVLGAVGAAGAVLLSAGIAGTAGTAGTAGVEDFPNTPRAEDTPEGGAAWGIVSVGGPDNFPSNGVAGAAGLADLLPNNPSAALAPELPVGDGAGALAPPSKAHAAAAIRTDLAELTLSSASTSD